MVLIDVCFLCFPLSRYHIRVIFFGEYLLGEGEGGWGYCTDTASMPNTFTIIEKTICVFDVKSSSAKTCMVKMIDSDGDQLLSHYWNIGIGTRGQSLIATHSHR